MYCRLQDDTVALRIVSAPNTKRSIPFGCRGQWFGREPKIYAIGERLDNAYPGSLKQLASAELFADFVKVEDAYHFCLIAELVTDQLSLADCCDLCSPLLPVAAAPPDPAVVLEETRQPLADPPPPPPIQAPHQPVVERKPRKPKRKKRR